MSTALARRFKVDVSLTDGSYIPIKGINDLGPKINPNNQSADDYDTDGWQSFEKTQQGWTITIKALRKQTSGVFDPGQELIRGQQLGWGDAARVWVRWYDRNGAPEAYKGRALVEWVPAKTGVADLDEVTITLTGDGVLSPIANPVSGSTSTPVVSNVDPQGAGTGDVVTVSGSNFTGATSVKFGGTTASFRVLGDSAIAASLPTGAAGSANVTVTNGTGTSNSYAYTRAA